MKSDCWGIENGLASIITPSRNILHGITRQNILKIVKNHFDCEERDITIEEFLKADEAFISGSTKRIVPIQSVDNHVFKDSKITHEIRDLLIKNERWKMMNDKWWMMNDELQLIV